MPTNLQNFQDWIAQIKSLPGISAAGIRFPDSSSHSDSNFPDFPTPHLDSAWQHFANVIDGLKGHRVQPLRMCWTYENAAIHYICRPDGICLALICMTGLGAPEPDLVNQLAEQFLGD